VRAVVDGVRDGLYRFGERYRSWYVPSHSRSSTSTPKTTCRLRENFALRAVGDDAAARDEDYPVDLRDDVREIVRH